MKGAGRGSDGAEEAQMGQRSCWEASTGIGSADAGSAWGAERLVEVRRHEACTAEAQVVPTLGEVAAEEA